MKLENIEPFFSSKKSIVIGFVFIAIVSFLMHLRVFNKDLMSMHVWRQTQTQALIESIYEGESTLFTPTRDARGDGNGVFRMEFPIMQWSYAQAYKVFGNKIIVSRMLSFFIALLSIFGIFYLLKALLRNKLIALLVAWAFSFAPTFFYHSVNPMPDNFALCFAIWACFFFVKWFRKGHAIDLLFSAILLGISSLAKLPFILYFALPIGLLFYKEYRKRSFLLNPILYSIFALPALAWYIWVIPTWKGNGITSGILGFQKETVLKALDNFSYHAIGNLPENLVNYASFGFFVAGLFFMLKLKAQKKHLYGSFAITGVLLILYLFFESNMVGKSHDYYLYPFFPFIFIVLGYGLKNIFLLKKKLLLAISFGLLALLPLTTHLRLSNRWNPESPGFNKDLLTYKEELRNAAPNDALCIAGSDKSAFIYFYYINKKGWSFNKDYYNYNSFKESINKGAQYLYSDFDKINTDPKFAKHLDKLILKKGSISVYKLKK